jgi:hypothetical protein
MSETIACLCTFIIFLIFLCVLFYLWRQIPPAGLPAGKAFELLMKANNWKETAAILFLFSPNFLRTGIGGIIVAIAGSGFAALGAICGGFGIEELKEIRKMLLDFYDFVERLRRQ